LETLEATREPTEVIRRSELAFTRRVFGLPQRLLTWLPDRRVRIHALQRLAHGVRLSRTALVDLAVLAFEKEKNRRPKGWTDLVPDYLSIIPLDPATGKPLDYRF
jgi:hypothetical protein